MSKEIKLTGYKKVDEKDLTQDEFIDILRNSCYGQILINENRFGKLKPLDASVNVWTEKLGRHGNNFDHMLQTRDEAKQMMANLPTAKENKLKVEVASLSHDIHEAITGDKAHPDMTKEDRDQEKKVSAEVLSDILFDDLDYVERQKLIQDVQEIAFDETTELGRLFNAIEILGYTNAAINAWNCLTDEQSDLETALRVLAHRVIPFHLPELINYSKEYPYLEEFLQENSDIISDVLAEAEICDTNWELRDKKGFIKGKDAWEKYTASLAA